MDIHGMSYDELRRKINAALNPGDRHDRWVRDLYSTHVIYEADKDGLFSAAYSVSESGEVALGEPTRVRIEYVQSANSISLPGGAPAEIQVVPFGRHETSKGAFELDEAGMAAIMADFASRANDMVIDYEHQTLGGGEAPAAGWIKRLINKGREGLWAVVEWTPRAVEYLKNKEYRYLSPVLLKAVKDGRVVKLLNAALTNQPAIDGMVPVVNRALYENDQPKKEVTRMKKLFELLGLKAEATEGEAIEAVTAIKAEAAKLTPTVEAYAAIAASLGLNADATASEVTGTVLALKEGSGQAGELSQRVAKLEAELRAKEAGDLVEAAMNDGKVTAANREWALGYAAKDPEGFKAFVAKAPKVVPLGEIGGGSEQGGGAHIDEVQVSVNTALRIDAETFKKYAPEKEDS